MTTPASPLVQGIRAKFPGAYDDMDNNALEQSVLQKHPEYKDMASPAAQSGALTPGTFQTQKGGKTYNANDLGTKELEYPTMSAGISGSMARSKLPEFPQQVKDATTESVRKIPSTLAVASAPGLVGELGSAGAAGKLLPFAKRAATGLVGGLAGGTGGKYIGRHFGGDTGEAIGETVGGLTGALAGGGAFGEKGRTIGNPRELPFVGKYLPDLLPEEEPFTPQGPQRMGQEEFEKVHGAKLAEADKAAQAQAAQWERLRNLDASSQSKDVPKVSATKPSNKFAMSVTPPERQAAIPRAGAPIPAQDFAQRQAASVPPPPAPKPGTFTVARPETQGFVPRVAAPTPAQEFSARQSQAPPVTRGASAEAGGTPQDLISRTKKLVMPGESPNAEDLKRAGDFTQVPLSRLKLLSSWGDKLAENEIIRRQQNP